MMKSQYDEQAKFLAGKMKEITLIELYSALEQNRLQLIKKESIKDVAEIVYWYFKELNRPYGGGFIYCNINDIIETALTSYKYAMYGEKYLSLLEKDDWRKLLEETEAAFKEKVTGLNISLEGNILDEMNGQSATHIFINNPIYEFPYVGNADAFATSRKDGNGLVIKEQFFDRKGRILQEPVRYSCIDYEFEIAKRKKLV